MQTKAGAAKARATIYKKYGPDYYKKNGALGGKKGTTGGFYHMKATGQDEKIREAAAKGGSISRRGPGKKTLEAKAEVNQVRSVRLGALSLPGATKLMEAIR